MVTALYAVILAGLLIGLTVQVIKQRRLMDCVVKSAINGAESNSLKAYPNQPFRYTNFHRTDNHSSRKKIDNKEKIQPTFISFYIGNICDS